VNSAESCSRPTTMPVPRFIRLSRRATAQAPTRLAVVAAVACGAAFSLVLAPDLHGLLGAVLAGLAVLIAAIDARYFIIPDELTVTTLVLGLAAAVAREPAGWPEPMLAAASRGLALALMFWVFRASYGWLRGREGIGLGDVKLAGVAGVWLAWPTIPVAIEIAAVAALVTVLIRRSTVGQEIQATTRLPFGLFLAPSIWLGWLVENASLSSISLSWF